MRIRRSIALFLPVAALATALYGLVYLVGQQALRTAADDPQIQLVEDAAARLDAGAAPSEVIGSRPIDIARSLAPFVVVYDSSGAVLASDGSLDGASPRVPSGVLESARTTGLDKVTWQPREGVRMATVAMPWGGGTVLAGRSLRIVEERVDRLGLLVALAWLVSLVGLGLASFIASSIWPTHDSG